MAGAGVALRSVVLRRPPLQLKRAPETARGVPNAAALRAAMEGRGRRPPRAAWRRPGRSRCFRRFGSARRPRRRREVAATQLAIATQAPPDHTPVKVSWPPRPEGRRPRRSKRWPGRRWRRHRSRRTLRTCTFDRDQVARGMAAQDFGAFTTFRQGTHVWESVVETILDSVMSMLGVRWASLCRKLLMIARGCTAWRRVSSRRSCAKRRKQVAHTIAASCVTCSAFQLYSCCKYSVYVIR